MDQKMIVAVCSAKLISARRFAVDEENAMLINTIGNHNINRATYTAEIAINSQAMTM